MDMSMTSTPCTSHASCAKYGQSSSDLDISRPRPTYLTPPMYLGGAEDPAVRAVTGSRVSWKCPSKWGAESARATGVTRLGARGTGGLRVDGLAGDARALPLPDASTVAPSASGTLSRIGERSPPGSSSRVPRATTSMSRIAGR